MLGEGQLFRGFHFCNHLANIRLYILAKKVDGGPEQWHRHCMTVRRAKNPRPHALRGLPDGDPSLLR